MTTRYTARGIRDHPPLGSPPVGRPCGVVQGCRSKHKPFHERKNKNLLHAMAPCASRWSALQGCGKRHLKERRPVYLMIAQRAQIQAKTFHEKKNKKSVACGDAVRLPLVGPGRVQEQAELKDRRPVCLIIGAARAQIQAKTFP